MLFLQHYFCIGNLFQDIFSNYSNNWATLLKPQFSSYPGSDFIVNYFIIVKLDIDRLKLSKISYLEIIFFFHLSIYFKTMV